jgi:hypothetical protein
MKGLIGLGIICTVLLVTGAVADAAEIPSNRDDKPVEAPTAETAPTAKGQTQDNLEAESQEEPPEPERRRLRELLYGATPEEQERLSQERQRLSKAAAAFGTDPTAIIGYYQLGYGHSAFTTGLRTDSATAVVRVPVTPNLLFQVTTPYVWADPNQPNGSTINGLSDMVVRMAGRLYASENWALAIGSDATFPTATETRLGTGKYTIGPGAALAIPMPRARSLFLVVAEDFNSVGGDPSRANVHFMRVQPAINTIWSQHWWTSLIGTWDMNWNKNRRTAFNLLFEVGHNFDNHWNVFAGPGVGLVGKDTPFGLDYTIQAGIRWVYATPLIPETLFKVTPFGTPASMR